MCLRLQANSSTALFHSLHGILNLVDAALGAPCGDITVVLAAVHGGRGMKGKVERRRMAKVEGSSCTTRSDEINDQLRCQPPLRKPIIPFLVKVGQMGRIGVGFPVFRQFSPSPHNINTNCNVCGLHLLHFFLL